MSDANPSTWIGVAFAALALVGTFVNALFTRLNNKDRIDSEAKFAILEAKQQACQEKHDECEEKHDEVLKKLEQRDREYHQTEARLWALENHLQRPPDSSTRLPRAKPKKPATDDHEGQPG